MQFVKLGATALAAVFISLAAAAPAAHAQTPQQPVQLSKAMITPMNEARNAVVAKDWATAKTKLDASAALAKTPQEKLAVERLRIVMAANTNDFPLQVTTLKSMIGSGLLAPEEAKQFKGALVKSHLDAGDTAAGNAAFRTYIEEYGGTHDQYAGIANEAAKANDNANAVIYANKAIEAARAASGKPPESYYRVLLKAHKQANEMDKYYAAEEAALADYPNEAYWKELIARVQTSPGYGPPVRLDMFRTLLAAGVKLTPQETKSAAQIAKERGLPNEALQLLEPAVASGALNSTEDQDNLKSAKSLSASDKAGLAKETTDILAKGSATDIASIGEAHLSYGDYAKAAEVLQAALTKGISDTAEADLVKLHLGVAQFRGGQKDAAVATWAQIKPDNATGILAHNWTLISKLKS